jgi:acetyl-CoA C-acetyltransferase
MPAPEAVIVATARTPIGRAVKGSLAEARPDDLSAFIITTLLEKAGIDGKLVEDIMWGCAQPAGEAGFNIARVAGVLAGLDVPGVTVNRYCSSSLQAIRMASHAIRAGEGDIFISGGVEAVSRFMNGAADRGPHNEKFAEAEARTARRAEGKGGRWKAPEGLPDIYIAMGQTAENVAEFKKVSRQKQDEFATQSQNRAEAAQARGFFEREITPYTVPSGAVVSKDDGIRPGTTYEALASLKPVFKPNGTVTAGNACPLNDGAAAVLVMSAKKAQALGLTPLAKIISSGVTAVSPEIMGLGPVDAIKQALKRSKVGRSRLTIGDIDLFEINEAFAAQVVPSAEALKIPYEKLNVNGGAIALGHPFGMTGARIMTTLINGLDDADKEFGVESMCIGGGQGMAMVIQRLR